MCHLCQCYHNVADAPVKDYIVNYMHGWLLIMRNYSDSKILQLTFALCLVKNLRTKKMLISMPVMWLIPEGVVETLLAWNIP